MKTLPIRFSLAFMISLALSGASLRAQALERPAAAPVPPSAAALPGPAAARASLIAYAGDVDLQKGTARPARVRRIPAALGVGDRLKTGRGGRATVVFPEGSRVELGPATTLIIDQAAPQRVGLRLELGRLRAWAAKLQSRRFEVRTPVAVLAVRGTEFSADVPSRKRTRAELYSGLLSVKDLKGKEVLLRPGQGLEVFEDRIGSPQALENKTGSRGEPAAGEGLQARAERAREELRTELAREIGYELERDRVETAVCIETRLAPYQEGKLLIDSLGRRVRLDNAGPALIQSALNALSPP